MRAAAALGFVCRSPVFRLAAVSALFVHASAPWVCSSPATSMQLSRLSSGCLAELAFGLACGAHRRLRRERTPQYSSRSPRRTYWLFRGQKRAQTQLTKELYWSGCSHIQKCDHMIRHCQRSRATREPRLAEFAVSYEPTNVRQTSRLGTGRSGIHRQVRNWFRILKRHNARSLASARVANRGAVRLRRRRSVYAAGLAAAPSQGNFTCSRETHAPGVVPWPERCRSGAVGVHRRVRAP